MKALLLVLGLITVGCAGDMYGKLYFPDKSLYKMTCFYDTYKDKNGDVHSFLHCHKLGYDRNNQPIK
jgi:hypothetical protein